MKIIILVLFISILNIVNAQSTYEIVQSFNFGNQMDEKNDEHFELQVALPIDIDKKQKLLSHQFKPQPDRFFHEMGTSYAIWSNYDSIEKYNFDIEIKSFIKCQYQDFENKINNTQKDALDNASLNRYLIQETDIECDHPLIKSNAELLLEKSDLETIKKIFQYITDSLTRDTQVKKRKGALQAFLTKSGDDYDYSTLMVASCRSVGIPARLVRGYTSCKLNQKCSCNVGFWAEAYVEDLGWVLLDPFNADMNTIISSFTPKNKNYIYFSLDPMPKFHKVSPFAKKIISAEKTKIVSSNINYRLEETGTNLYNSNDLINAELFFDSLILLNEEYFNAWNFKGMIQSRQRKFETGFNCLNIALNLAKKDNEKYLVFYSFSNYFALKGDNANSIIYLEKAIKLGFNNFEAIVNDKDLITIQSLNEFVKLMQDYFPENIKK